MRERLAFTVLVLVCFATAGVALPVPAALPPVPEIPTAPESVSPGAVRHVNNETGKDAPRRGAAERPWASLRYAVERLGAGQTLVVHGTGTPYQTDWAAVTRSGTRDRWITIRGEPGAEGRRPTLEGRLSFGRQGNGVGYVHLRGVDFRGPGGSNVNIGIEEGSHHLILEDLEVDCQKSPENSRAVWTNDHVRDVWFKDVHVHHCGYGRRAPTDCGGICVKGSGIDNIVFRGVRVSHNVGDGIGGGSRKTTGRTYFEGCVAEANTGDGFDLAGRDLVVVRNTISRNNGGHQGTAYKFWSAESWLVYSVAYDNDGHGIMVRPRHAGDSALYVVNSTFALNYGDRYGGQVGTSAEHPQHGTLSLYLYNNIFYTLNSSAVVISNAQRQKIAGEGHNYYFTVRRPGPRTHWSTRHAVHIRDRHMDLQAGYSFEEVGNGRRWARTTGHGAGNLGERGDDLGSGPGFVDIQAGDLRLREGSGAVDAGADLGLDRDIDGKPVPTGAAPDMGAYEGEVTPR